VDDFTDLANKAAIEGKREIFSQIYEGVLLWILCIDKALFYLLKALFKMTQLLAPKKSL
jgi:hypothetical protein